MSKRLTVSLFSTLSRELDHIPNAFALALKMSSWRKKRVATLLRGHLALATLSLLVNDPQILEDWGHAHEVHLDKCNLEKDFGLEFWYDVQ